jgi:D-lactate dehydrogenase (quinone)
MLRVERKLWRRGLGLSVGGGLCVGYSVYRDNHSVHHREDSLVLPSGYPRSCCDHGASYLSNLPQPSENKLKKMISSFSLQLHSLIGTERSETKKPTNISFFQISQCENPNLMNLIKQLSDISGKENVLLSTETNLTPYTKGTRIGQGDAEIIFRPGTLKEAVNGLKACVASDVVIIPQGRNTGLTGGSVPRPTSSQSRPTVVFNMTRLKTVHRLDDQVLCFAGVGIHDLSILASQQNRESHSILGSVFLNPTVAAGLAFGSGGTQIRKGPAYTERALWCTVNKDGQVILHNTLGIGSNLLTSSSQSSTPPIEDEGILGILDHHLNTIENVSKDIPASCAKKYTEHLCQIDDQISRYNADTSGIDPCRSEGKVLILASIHDTFPIPKEKKSYWISCHSLEDAYLIRNKVLLDNSADLPISCEYMNQDSYEVIDSCGRILCYCLSFFGINDKLFTLWNLKLFIESISSVPFLNTLPDKLLYHLNPLFPTYLPPHIHSLHRTHSHHLLLTVGDYDSSSSSSSSSTIEKIEKKLYSLQDSLRSSSSSNQKSIEICELRNSEEVLKVNNFRFVAAIAFKVWCVGNQVNGISIDYSQRKNDITEPDIAPAAMATGKISSNDEQVTTAPAKITTTVVPLLRMRYSHFGCNVIHEDLGFDLIRSSAVTSSPSSSSSEEEEAVRGSVDRMSAIERYKKSIKKIIESQGGKLPAEHGHGIEYLAPAPTQERWMRMDPMNVMNPGIGGLSEEKYYGRGGK